MDLSEVRGTVVRHPWETARAAAIERVLMAAHVEPETILDYGCGDGFTGERMLTSLRAARLTGFDIHLTNEQCEARSREQITYTNDWEHARTGRFDLCLLCDVIEHVEDDRALLERVQDSLSAQGQVLLTVPAFQTLFTSHDRALRHFRRYTLAELEGVARSSGLQVAASGYLFASLLPARGIAKLSEAMKPKVSTDEFGIGAWTGSKALTRALETALNWDNSVLLALAARGIKLPGLSAWALCKKQSL